MAKKIAPDHDLVEPNEGLADKIQIIERGKSGAYGAVWKGRQGGRDVAVKVIHAAIAGTALAIKHFHALTRVENHRNVVRVYALTKVVLPEETVPVQAIVMEWLEGGTLEERLKGARLGLDDAKRICNEILNGLEFMHGQGIAHRDLHAGNVMLTVDGIKLIDIDCSQEYSLARLSICAQETALGGDIAFARHVIWSVITHSNADMEMLKKCEPAVRNAQTLQDLRNEVESLTEQEARSKPQTTDTLLSVENVEQLIEDRQVIRLRRALIDAASRSASILVGADFSPNAEANHKTYAIRVAAIEKELQSLLCPLFSTAFWGRDDEAVLATVVAIGNCYDELGLPGGTSWWLDLQAYPAALVLFAAGLGASSGGNYVLLKKLLNELPHYSDHNPCLLSEFIWNTLAAVNDLWNESLFPEKHYSTAVSMRIHDFFRPLLRSYFPLGRTFTQAFDRFEYFCGLQRAGQPDDMFPGWGPVGSFIWRNRRSQQQWVGDTVSQEAKSSGDDWHPLKAGLFGGTISSFVANKKVFHEHIQRVRHQLRLF